MKLNSVCRSSSERRQWISSLFLPEGSTIRKQDTLSPVFSEASPLSLWLVTLWSHQLVQFLVQSISSDLYTSKNKKACALEMCVDDICPSDWWQGCYHRKTPQRNVTDQLCDLLTPKTSELVQAGRSESFRWNAALCPSLPHCFDSESGFGDILNVCKCTEKEERGGLCGKHSSVDRQSWNLISVNIWCLSLSYWLSIFGQHKPGLCAQYILIHLKCNQKTNRSHYCDWQLFLCLFVCLQNTAGQSDPL